MASFASRFGSSVKGSRRMLLVIGVALVLVVGIWWLSSGNKGGPASEVRGPVQNQRTIQAQKAVSPDYERNLVQSDTQRVEKAKENGVSALPTVRAAEATNVGMPDESRKAKEDNGLLPRPRPPQLDLAPVGLPPMPPAPAPIRVVQVDQGPDPLIAQMRISLGEIGRPTYPAADVKYYYKPTVVQGVDQKALQAQVATGSNVGAGTVGGIPLPLAGTILYAELVGEANSDAPGPVIARVLQGDLAGSTLIGSFTPLRDSLGIRFTTLSLGTSAAGDDINKTVSINAVGVDSRTVSPGLATDVDRHFLVNVGTTAAAAFAQGFGAAVAQGGQSLTATSGVGYQVVSPVRSLGQQFEIAGGAAAGAAGAALVQAYGNRPPTITIAAGTPVGVLFLPGN